MTLRTLAVSTAILAAYSTSATESITVGNPENDTIESYNASLPYWGTSWVAGGRAVNGYYPSFYTGFAPRIENPARLHIRLARGNQTRVSAILDEESIRHYLFDLVKRREFYSRMTSGPRPIIDVQPDVGRTPRVLPQLDFFSRIVDSAAYGISSFVASAKAGGASREAVYAKSLDVMTRLNPGRLFMLRLDLRSAFLEWRAELRRIVADADPMVVFTAKSPATVRALNAMLPGRVNVSTVPSATLLSSLATVARAAVANTADDEFVTMARDLFRSATAGKYDFRVLAGGALVPALDCATPSACVLAYPEFTTIYPTGSIREMTSDRFGNSIPAFATPGLWRFVSRGSRAVDNIRAEPYYGWAPKMDYEAAGNGFHNPAVRFTSLARSVKDQLGIPAHHSTFWSVMRGGVSHGCSRLPLGHIWELRHLFPVADARMSQVDHFGSDARDFDVYDIDGNGAPEVMGVEYMISYGLRETEGAGSREGTDLQIGREHRLAYYQRLYGANQVFREGPSGTLLFREPMVSEPSYLDRLKKRVSVRTTLPGEYPLYEQTYERDKAQLYLPFTTEGLTTPGSAPLSKRIVRLMGRVRGCAPDADREACGEAEFDRETAALIAEVEAQR